MLEGKNIKCGNMVDLDSNLNNIYQQLDGLRQLQTQTLYLRNTTAKYMGYNSQYSQVEFTNSVTNFTSNGLSFNSGDSTINVDTSIYSDFKVNLSMQIYVPTNDMTKTIYIRIKEIDANGNESLPSVPFFRFPIGSVTGDDLKVISFGQLLDFKSTTKKIKLEATTNETTAAPSINSVHFDITGIARNMS